MSISGGLNIVQNGLILVLDAADRNSYPGTGNTVYDLSQNLYTGSLINGPTFDSANFGSFLFDGSNDFIDSQAFTPNFTSKTLMSWCKLNSISQQGGGLIGVMRDNVSGEPFDTITYNETNQGWGFGSNAYQRTQWSNVKETSTSTWVHIAATYADNNYNLYRNGVLILNTTLYTALNYNFDVKIIFGKRHGSTMVGPLAGYIAGGLVYNRALTVPEIQQNINAQKSRFNL